MPLSSLFYYQRQPVQWILKKGIWLQEKNSPDLTLTVSVQTWLSKILILSLLPYTEDLVLASNVRPFFAAPKNSVLEKCLAISLHNILSPNLSLIYCQNQQICYRQQFADLDFDRTNHYFNRAVISTEGVNVPHSSLRVKKAGNSCHSGDECKLPAF